MGKAKKVSGNVSFIPIDKSKPSLSSKVSKANNVKDLGIFGCKKIIQERGIDLNSCGGSYVYKVLMDRNWGSWIFILGVSNETMVREFYHVYKERSTVTSAVMNMRKVVFRVCARKLNEFLGLSNDIESDFLDVDVLENLDLMAKGLKTFDDDVILPPLEKLSEKRVTTMSYKEKGKSCDTFRLFGESLDSSHVRCSPTLPSWAMQLKNEVEESRRLIEASQRKIEDLSAKIVVQDERIKELEGKATPTKHYVRSSNRTTFLGGTSG
ncbi:hypothetical protein LWI29_020343 [Acer saccharum]|uniref:Uncharacterized protein n=1 Tax=Acer saccharum TaxID=4024 RepID=A0AA39TFR5_ACESA|nr:hypothetical protein LWI29_020343 [Acer saccharum]